MIIYVGFWLYIFALRYEFISEMILRFLYKNGRIEQVGMYLRNQNLTDKSFPDSYKLRKECERIHGHIKNTVKFDVRRVNGRE